MWCASCYTSIDLLPFVYKGKTGLEEADEDDGELEDLERRDQEKRGDRKEYKYARNGDTLQVPFECDLCVFRKLKGTDPGGGEADKQLMCCIRRVNLDAFWARAKTTVRLNYGLMKQSLIIGEKLGIGAGLAEQGPLPPYDHCGYHTAIMMVYASVDKGKHSVHYKQYNTVRHMGSMRSSYLRTCLEASTNHLVVGDDRSNARGLSISVDPTCSLWFRRFLQGSRKRMGQDWRPDQAITAELVKACQDECERRVWEQEGERWKWILTGAYLITGFALGFRGSEGLLLNLTGQHRHWRAKSEGFVTVCLLGQLKGDEGEQLHLMHSVNETGSGLRVREWLERLMRYNESHGRQSGNGYKDPQGELVLGRWMEARFHEVLLAVWDRDPRLFPSHVENEDDVVTRYRVFRSLRRGSETRSMAQKVSSNDRHVVLRWKAPTKGGGHRVSKGLEQLYTDVSLLKKPFLRYTAEM